MRKIRWWVEMCLNGCDADGEIEVDDDTPEEEIDHRVKEEVFNCITWGWHHTEQSESE